MPGTLIRSIEDVQTLTLTPRAGEPGRLHAGAGMEFRILGPLEVVRGDCVVRVRGRRQRALLALLVLRAGEVVASERLIDELWGSTPPVSGPAALQVRVSQLRKALWPGPGHGLIVTRPPGYFLHVDAERIDSRQFERMLAEGRALLAEAEPERAAVTLGEALALWRGAPLADLSREPFARAEAARLDELRLQALEARVEADLVLGRHGDLVAELEALGAAHPFRERLRGQLMLSLYRSGRQADALATYRDARRDLVDELGIEPGPELRRLEQAILRQDPSLAPRRPSGTIRAARRVGAAEPRAPVAAPVEERKVVTVLFADLVRSTELVAAEDPERARAFLERYFETIAAEVAEAGGTLEKFIGDAAMAVFGAPVAQEDHAERALHVALAIRRRLGELFGDRLQVRIGIATGEVVVGRAREGGSFVTGLAVNVSARLEQASPPGEILVAERTARAAGAAFEFGQPAAVPVRGIAAGVSCRPLVRALTLARPRGFGGRPPVFVGREGELELLRATYNRVAAEGRSSLVTVLGDAGVGKSRLLREFWDWLAAQTPAPRRRIGRCLSYGTGITYRPLGDVLHEELGLLESDPPERVLQRLGDRRILGLVRGLQVEPSLHPLAARERLHEAWVELLDELVAERPAVVLIEDLHWAEDPLLDLLERMLRDVRGPLMVVGTARPEFHESRRWSDGHPDAATIRLDPLGRDDAGTLLEKLVAADLPEPLRRLVIEQAEGNPFFLEELLSSLADQGVLVRAGDGWAAREEGPEIRVPDSIQSVLAARIDLLPPSAKAALQAASVIGRVFWRGPVRELLEDDVPDFAVLEAHDFTRRRAAASISGEREYVFKHALTREVAYAGIPKARRARLHASFAGWLERSGGGRDEHAPLLAHHYAEAARPDDADLAWAGETEECDRVRAGAVAWLRRAGELAVSRYELDEALSLFDRALELEQDAAAGSAIWRAIGRANALKYDGEAFLATMLRSLESCQSRPACAETYSELAFQTAIRSGMWKQRPSSRLVDSWIERALELAEAGSPARARALLAQGFWHPDRAHEAAVEASAVAEQLGDPELRSYAWDLRGAAAFALGEYDLGNAFAERRFELLDELTDPDAHADTHSTPIAGCIWNGRFREARRLARCHDAITEPLTPHHRMHGVATLVEVEELLGDWENVRALAGRTRAAVAENSDTPCVRNARTLLVSAAASAVLGHGTESLALEAQADELGMDGFGHVLDTPRLRLALARRDLARVEELLALDRGDRGWYWGWLALATLVTRLDGLAALGDRDGVECETAGHMRPNTYVAPFALRALGVVRDDEASLLQSLAGFEALGLEWHADETRRLLAGSRPGS